MLQGIPYLTAPNLPALSGASVRDAHNFQDVVEDSIRNWYGTRLSSDFLESNNGAPKTSPGNVQRWMAHLLLTTTVNFATSTSNGSTYTADMNHFFNSELLLSGTDFGILVGYRYLCIGYQLNILSLTCNNSTSHSITACTRQPAIDFDFVFSRSYATKILHLPVFLLSV
jgi:hypothetical protein